MAQNRIARCFVKKKEDKICNCLEELAYEIREKERKLEEGEWKELMKNLETQKSPFLLYRLWSAAIFAGYYEDMRQFCEKYAYDEGNVSRDLAVTYLGRNFPDFRQKLWEDFQESEDANILFSLIQLLDNTERERRMALVLKCYDYIDPYDHQLHENLQYLLETDGRREHLKYFEDLVKDNPAAAEKYEVPLAVLKKKFP